MDVSAVGISVPTAIFLTIHVFRGYIDTLERRWGYWDGTKNIYLQLKKHRNITISAQKI